MNKETSPRACLSCASQKIPLMARWLTAFLWILVVAISCIFVATGSAHAAKANVTLNGYTFAEDSAEIWANQFFTNFYIQDQPCLYYGSWIHKAYGSFDDMYIGEFFDRIESYKDITCVVYREHGYWPEWVKRSGTPGSDGYVPGHFIFTRYTRYNFIAKDVVGNIHILQSIRPNEEDLDDEGIIIEGGTTLMYPADPKKDQPVYQGYVVDIDTPNTSASVKRYAHCMAIHRMIKYGIKNNDVLYGIVVYLQPGWGIIEMNYNWPWYYDDPYYDVPHTNGFSQDESLNTYATAPNYTPEEVAIHGYTFNDLSANIWENEYFGTYNATTITGYTKVLYGYGDFKSYDIGIFFDSFSTANNVNCVVLRERGYLPKGTTTTDTATGKSTTTFTFTPYTRYNYLAKDKAGNIHLLRSVSGSEDLNADAITASGGTTIIYPGTPVENQLVSNGMVVGISSTIDTFTECLSIRRGSSPEVTFDYYKKSSGLVTSVYNWGSTANGFSLNKNPDISSLPSAGGKNTGTVNTDPTTTASKKDDNGKMWYECFIGTSTLDGASTAHGGIFLLLMTIIMSLRAAFRPVEK